MRKRKSALSPTVSYRKGNYKLKESKNAGGKVRWDTLSTSLFSFHHKMVNDHFARNLKISGWVNSLSREEGRQSG